MRALILAVLVFSAATPAEALEVRWLASESASESPSDPQSKAWGKLAPFIYEMDFALLSLASLADWGPPTNGYVSGFLSVVLLGVSSANLILNPDPEKKWQSVPGVLSGLLLGYLSYYSFTTADAPSTRAWTTFLGYNVAMAPVLIQVVIFSYS